MTNTAHSVKDRLLKLAKERGEEFNFVLVRYGLERLLYRLSRSTHVDQFVLKGAMLFTVWAQHPHRATKDLDLLGVGSPEMERLAEVFRDVCATDVEDDGLDFDPKSVSATRIKEDAEYEGVRVTLRGKLGSARIALQIDVGFGDAISPAPALTDFPTLLDQPSPRVRAYPRETVVAEKLHAIVYLGMANSRMKDFFDLWFLCREFAFDGPRLVQAVRATFERRATALPEDVPTGLTESFATNATKHTQWRAFLRRSRVTDDDHTLQEVVATISPFLLPVLQAANEEGATLSTWPRGGPWS